MSNPAHEKIIYQAKQDRQIHLDLPGADLAGIAIASPFLEGANLENANLVKAELSGAYGKGSNLRGSRLQKAKLILCDLRQANLSSADLSQCDLSNSILSGADLSKATLVKTRLIKTRLDQVNLSGANIHQADFRGALGLTAEQLAHCINVETAIFDKQMSVALGRTVDVQTARYGKQAASPTQSVQVDLIFQTRKPGFGDLFELTGDIHPNFPPSGEFNFSQLADLRFEQVDDYFAVCEDGDPIIWLYPMVDGKVVHHHPGPFDGIRLELAAKRYRKRWSACLDRLRKLLT